MAVYETIRIEISGNQGIAPVDRYRIRYERLQDFFSCIARVAGVFKRDRELVIPEKL